MEGLNEILTVTRLGLPSHLRRSLACTNIIENMIGTVRRVCRNVKRWDSASMALRSTATAMLIEARKGFRKLKAYKQLAALRPPSKLITKGYQITSLLISKRKSRNLQCAATASPS
jgi:hypothetical protein